MPSLTPISATALTLTANSAPTFYAGFYPASTTYPSSTLYPGLQFGAALSAASTAALTLSPA